MQDKVESNIVKECIYYTEEREWKAKSLQGLLVCLNNNKCLQFVWNDEIFVILLWIIFYDVISKEIMCR